ncbi:hypothetical protein HMPREF3185_02177 [Porphyromonas somerae]|uniref:Uncharacterized protein n=1 Tax=Porphyromonas somerae TaxID=322095 RepID=A0A134AYU4_9PORP|nr:hypothetical protein HMPREF3184_02177 [Porphyromonadaceae bacterium KA00676]KXB72862.1 hypothetical protein HMPREF3185_02177 [Porphyromonas somerae]
MSSILIEEADSNLYWSTGEPILVVKTTYIGRDADLYRSTRRSI